MDWPFEYNWKVGDYVVQQIEGVADIAHDPDGDWYIAGLIFEGFKHDAGLLGKKAWVRMSKEDSRYHVICEQIYRTEAEDIADAWATHEAENGPANAADFANDLAVLS